jgi:iron-sulfur cluster assembly protein
MELTITDDAVEAIKAVLGQKEGGLRITTVPQSANGRSPGLALEPVPEPEPEDEVIESEGAELYLEEGTLGLLDGKVLDAEREGEAVRFAILEGE